MENRTQKGQELYELGKKLGGLGMVAIGSAGGTLARTLARAAGCGAALTGGSVRFHDGSCAACAAWLGRFYGLPASLFIRQWGEEISLFVLDSQGRSFVPGEACFHRTDVEDWDLLTGVDSAWAAARAGDRRQRGTVAARGPAALTLALERMGYEVLDRPAPGVPLFESDTEGFQLRVELDGAVFRPQGIDALAAAAEFTPRPQAIPAFHPDGNGPEQT